MSHKCDCANGSGLTSNTPDSTLLWQRYYPGWVEMGTRPDQGPRLQGQPSAVFRHGPEGPYCGRWTVYYQGFPYVTSHHSTYTVSDQHHKLASSRSSMSTRQFVDSKLMPSTAAGTPRILSMVPSVLPGALLFRIPPQVTAHTHHSKNLDL